MKIAKKITIAITVWVCIYIVGLIGVRSTEMRFRAWVNVAGLGALMWLLPLMALILIIIELKKNQTFGKAIKGIIIGILSCGFLVWVYVSIWIIAFICPEEKVLTKNLMVVNDTQFLSESNYVYFRPISFMFRTPGKLTEKDKMDYLVDKYGTQFDINLDGEAAVYSVDFPEVPIEVSLIGGDLDDDFIEGVIAKLVPEGMEAMHINRNFYTDDSYIGINGITFIELKDESDISGFAKDMTVLFQYICEKAPLFADNRGYVYFYVPDSDIHGMIPFGKLGRWDDMDKEYYRNTLKMEDYIKTKYDVSAGE